jgi:hypothetical protein
MTKTEKFDGLWQLQFLLDWHKSDNFFDVIERTKHVRNLMSFHNNTASQTPVEHWLILKNDQNWKVWWPLAITVFARLTQIQPVFEVIKRTKNVRNNMSFHNKTASQTPVEHWLILKNDQNWKVWWPLAITVFAWLTQIEQVIWNNLEDYACAVEHVIPH